MAKKLGLKIQAKFCAYAVAGVPPEIMGIGNFSSFNFFFKYLFFIMGNNIYDFFLLNFILF